MKNILIILLNLLNLNMLAQTFYYEQIAVVKNNNKTHSSGDGHFITFTSDGCYDSDRNGYSEETGYRKYLKTENNIRNYYGDTYLGKAYYYFSTDFSRLNVKNEKTGIIYVYEKRRAPDGIIMSPRKQRLIQIEWNVYNIVNENNSNNNTTSNSKRKCNSCRGTGKGSDNIVWQTDYTGKGYRIWCDICGKTTTPHSHRKGTCKICNGKGYIE